MKVSRGISCVAAAALLGLLAGCGHMPRPHLAWPWGHKAAPAPQEVHELTITPAAEGVTAAYPQYWKRNTLLVDLHNGGGTGGIVLKPVEGTTWPVRIAFRVMPGQFGALEVRGDERLRLPITPQGTKPVDLELSPDIYTSRTPQLTVTWGPATASPES